jgi:hypothetical protein
MVPVWYVICKWRLTEASLASAQCEIDMEYLLHIAICLKMACVSSRAANEEIHSVLDLSPHIK